MLPEGIIDPQAWLADVLARIAEHPAHRIDEFCHGTGGQVRCRAVRRGLIVAAISAVFTIGYVANQLGEDADWLFDLSINMFPEDGFLWVYGVGEDGVPYERAAGRAPPQAQPPK